MNLGRKLKNEINRNTMNKSYNLLAYPKKKGTRLVTRDLTETQLPKCDETPKQTQFRKQFFYQEFRIPKTTTD